LSDGKLSVAEILAMGSTGSLPNLIFSNACHSALSCANLLEQDCQQRAYSVASAFLFSGVRHYIGAIRKIEDPLSLNFARQFYTHLISGNSMGEAIRLSRLKLIHDCGSRSVHWTSYLLYGDPNFILFRPRGPALSAKGKKAAIFRSRLAWVGLSLGAISLSLYLYMWLPTLNPGTYYLFLKSKSSFLKGANSQVIATAKKITLQDPQFLPIYPLLGDTYQRLGDREKALKYYFDYALFSEKKQDKKNLASAFNGIGWIYYLQGDYARSKEFYELALGISRQNHDLENEADVLGKLAIWHLDKKDYDQALELLTKSSEINRDRQHIYRHKYNLACDYFNLGLLFTEKDDFSTAGEFYNKSFHLFKKLKMKHELSDYYFNMGEIYSFQKEYQKALDQYHKGLAIDLSQQNKPSLAADYNMLGELYLNMDNFTTAEKYFQDAAGLAREINAKPELAGAYYNLGLLYSKIGRKNKARENLRAAQEIYRGIDSCLYQDIKEILLALDN
jgi:tetratricopeptide (TPR) repeat protein